MEKERKKEREAYFDSSLIENCLEILYACIENFFLIMSAYSSHRSLPSFHTFYELARRKKVLFRERGGCS